MVATANTPVRSTMALADRFPITCPSFTIQGVHAPAFNQQLFQIFSICNFPQFFHTSNRLAQKRWISIDILIKFICDSSQTHEDT